MPTSGCVLPPINPSCSDPAYRAAHPTECEGFPVLRLLPEYALTEPSKTVQYTVTLLANGVEVQLEKGLAFSVSNLGVASINDDGLATGVTPGTSTVSVTWQDLSAHAQLDVVADCAEVPQHFAIVIDNSKSMNQAFSSSYATKLSFSKETAAAFAGTINTSRDSLSVWEFGSSATELVPFGTDIAAAQSAINGISITAEKTDIDSMLRSVIDSFPSDGVKVIVLFTDFEWTGTDPHSIANRFKEGGGFLIVIATESWGEFFQDACECASAGFLLSAYDDTEDSVIENLKGLKGFVCNEGCNDSEIAVPYACLNYTGFIKWDVTAGRVDLVGLDVFDVRPGNGLVVDMAGTGDSGYPPPGQDFGLGQITSKDEFEFEDGKDYLFSLKVSGSLPLSPPEKPGTWTIRVRVGDGVDETITITDGGADFATHEFEWTQSGNFTGKIIIEQTNIGSAHHNVGTIIDDVLLQNVTDDGEMLFDDFNEENPTILPVNPGYYSLCLTPEAQVASPEPPSPRVSE